MKGKFVLKLVHCFDHLVPDDDDQMSERAFMHLSGGERSWYWANRNTIFELARLHGWMVETRKVRKDELDDQGG